MRGRPRKTTQPHPPVAQQLQPETHVAMLELVTSRHICIARNELAPTAHRLGRRSAVAPSATESYRRASMRAGIPHHLSSADPQ
jgi:hypothetical protein